MNTQEIAAKYTDQEGKLNFPNMASIVQFVNSSGSHFFDKETMDFWGTELIDVIYGGIYFITHETVFCSNTTKNGRYVLRRVYMEGGKARVETIDHSESYAEMGAYAIKLTESDVVIGKTENEH